MIGKPRAGARAGDEPGRHLIAPADQHARRGRGRAGDQHIGDQIAAELAQLRGLVLVVDDPPGAEQRAQHRQPGGEHEQVLLQERDRPGRLPARVGDRRGSDPDPQRRRPLDRVPERAEHRLRQRGDRIAGHRGHGPADALADDAQRVDPAAEQRAGRRRASRAARRPPARARTAQQRRRAAHQKLLHAT